MAESFRSYGGSVAAKPARLVKYTKADRDTILAKYRKLQAIHADEHELAKQLLNVLSGVQWAYPPADAIKDARRDKGSWFGPARCPLCFAEWNLAGIHLADCALGSALKGK